MLKVRVIPTILMNNFSVVKGVSFNSWRVVGTLLPLIKIYNRREVDELVLLDIAASNEKREPDYEIIKDISSECFVPLTVGGGISHIDHVTKLLRAGADKVCINSFAYINSSLITEVASLYGNQCVVVGIDALKLEDGSYECVRNSGTIKTGIKVDEWAKYVEEIGAGEIIITSIQNDGNMNGYDIELIKLVTEAVNIPVIASGGAGNFNHFYEAILEAKASAVAAASIFSFTQQTPKEVKDYLASKDIPVRNINIEKV
ncbi:imidazole glycerol phosphate synthase subunit HisF [Anaerobacillus alkaliphilus]|uniref:Imidazole glycerol phosphate synthase subunit HisF n=1 Tax=Anaerobacillus alkaliphilus TaxID=1548597 RepID=A0A4Q0VV25_9BACI|nr:imidazole glycerol phosphate synthase cyclase subunit [Anaerobacillus alkaliphilus]RXJ02274.1 imidazole glycerol phosphate synthase subunit HisF [Anaerobacillus alkaliphilus]